MEITCINPLFFLGEMCKSLLTTANFNHHVITWIMNDIKWKKNHNELLCCDDRTLPTRILNKKIHQTLFPDFNGFIMTGWSYHPCNWWLCQSWYYTIMSSNSHTFVLSHVPELHWLQALRRNINKLIWMIERWSLHKCIRNNIGSFHFILHNLDKWITSWCN